MSLHETPLTRAYWQSLGEGILYEELAVADAVPGKQSRRPVDGVVVLGHESADCRAASERVAGR